ncbi:hypothetical protein AN958_04443 [Leucoagaricus sp. SymC.cos]|nr:hypothetical protein AN958_04443 [Leucoagaricus sp. SymC.cos]
MSSTVNDVMPVTVPGLEQSGANWTIFQLCFQTAVQGKGLWGHFDGSKIRPVLSLPSVTVSPLLTSSPSPAGSGPDSSNTSSTPAPDSKAATVLLGTDGEILEWDRNKSIARSLLAQRLPNSTLIVVYCQPSVAKMWAAVTKEYTYKGTFSQTRLRRDFLSSRCPKDGNVHMFLNDLRA